MLTRIAAAVCFVAAVALVVMTLVSRGNPFGYRTDLAVIHEVVGTSEVRAQMNRPQRAVPGTTIGFDTEIRTGLFSSVLLASPGGTIHIFDSSALRTRKENEPEIPAWRISAGRLEIAVDSGEGMTVAPIASSAHVELRTGSYIVTADGKGLVAGMVREGTLLVHEGEGRPTEVKPGQMFILTPLSPAIVSDALPEVEIEAQINPRERPGDLATVSGQISPGGRIYINGELTYPDLTGAFEALIAPGAGEVVLVAEDLKGHAARTVLEVQK